MPIHRGAWRSAQGIQTSPMMRPSSRCPRPFLPRPMFLAGLSSWVSSRGSRGGAIASARGRDREADEQGKGLYARENLVAWCIVPFDAKKRGPEERAAMLERLGFKHFAYDWRAEHVPTFDAEIEALKRHGIELDAFWFRGRAEPRAQLILDVLKRHGVKTQLWVLLDMGADRVTGEEQERGSSWPRRSSGRSPRRRRRSAARSPSTTTAAGSASRRTRSPSSSASRRGGHQRRHRLQPAPRPRPPRPLRRPAREDEAPSAGGQPQRHGARGRQEGQKILPLGQGELDLDLLQTIRDSGYRGPIGILGHTQDDAEERLHDNLDGLDWLVPQLDGKPAGPRPKPRTSGLPTAPPAARQAGGPSTVDPERVAALIAEAREDGDPAAGPGSSSPRSSPASPATRSASRAAPSGRS